MSSSPKEKQKFIFGSHIYHYDLVMEERKTLSLTVSPNLEILVKCPIKAENDRIEKFLKRKWFWLEKQLHFFKKYQYSTYKKEYLSGESFFYLGRQYKLLVKHSKRDKVVLTKGVFLLETTRNAQDKQYNKKLLTKWFREKTETVFRERFEEIKEKFTYKNLPPLIIRVMQKRWGSCLENGTVILNPKLIHSAKECIDYVIVHELCHVRYKSHDKRFYTLLKHHCPNWEKVKDKLERIGTQTPHLPQ